MTKFSYFRLKYGELLDAGASNAVAAVNKPPQVCTDQYIIHYFYTMPINHSGLCVVWLLLILCRYH